MNKTFEDIELGNAGLFVPETAALLVVDVQQKLWPFINGRQEVLKRTLQAIDVAGNLKIPIIVTEQYVKGLGSTIDEVKISLEKWDAYNPIEKNAFSCFGEQKFSDFMESSNIETLAVVGIEGHVCVMQTVIDGLARGYDMFYISEAVGSRNPRHKEEAVTRVRDLGAIVGSVEMFAFEAMRASTHPSFKAVQKVIV